MTTSEPAPPKRPVAVRPRPVFVVGLSVRFRRRTAAFVGLATGRYWATGATRCEWHTDARLPFAHAGIVRCLPDRKQRVRVTFMGWRGIDHRPRPDLREWCWPTDSHPSLSAPTAQSVEQVVCIDCGARQTHRVCAACFARRPDDPAHSDGWQRPPHNGSSDSDGAAQS